MEALIGLLLLSAGAVVGFFIGKYRYADKENSNSEQAIKQLMAQQAAHYVSQSKQAIDQLGQQVELLQQQLTDYEALLNHQPSSEEQQQLVYFGDQASTYLRNKQQSNKPASSNAQSQPLDFSDGSSGLFTGAKNKQVTDTK